MTTTNSSTRRSLPRGGRAGLWAALIVAATLLAYLPALRAGFIWDDDDYVTHNPTLNDLGGLGRIWFEVGAVPQYYPLVHTAFWIEHHLWGDRPFGYHLINIILHALSAVLLGIALRRLSVPGAWFAAFVFALHPVQVESVAWVTERKNVLSAFFYLAALLAYLRFSRLDGGPVGEGPTGAKEREHGIESRDLRLYLAALGLFLCALLAKTVACSLPAAILLIVWWKRGRLSRFDVLPVVPFFAIGGVLGFTTMWMERYRVGALGKDWELTLLERILIAGRALWFYAGKLLWPRQLAFIYPRWQIDAGSWGQWLFPVAALAVVALLWTLRKRIGRGPLTAVLLFAGTLFPALGFFDVYPMRFSFVADHFQYLASIGLISLGAAVLTRLLVRLFDRYTRARPELSPSDSTPSRVPGRSSGETDMPRPGSTLSATSEPSFPRTDLPRPGPTSRKRLDPSAAHTEPTARGSGPRPTLGPPSSRNPLKYLEPALCGAVLLALGVLTWNQAHVYKDLESLWRDTLEKNPGSWMPHYNLGLVLDHDGRLDEGIAHYADALRLKPDLADAENNLGAALDRQGKTESALAHYREALRLKPDWPDAQSNLAWTLATNETARYRDGAQAVHLAAQACAATGFKQPAFLDTLAAAYAETGRFEDARRTAQSALALAAAAGLADLASEIRSHMERYEAGRPYHESDADRKRARPPVLERYGIVG